VVVLGVCLGKDTGNGNADGLELCVLALSMQQRRREFCDSWKPVEAKASCLEDCKRTVDLFNLLLPNKQLQRMNILITLVGCANANTSGVVLHL
jgi:hypothetical protein